MLFRKYRPRRATAEEALIYFLRYHTDTPPALLGSAMDKEAYLNAEAPALLSEAKAGRRPDIAA